MKFENRYQEIIEEIWSKKEKQTRRTRNESMKEATLVFAKECSGLEVNCADALSILNILVSEALNEEEAKAAFDTVYAEETNSVSFPIKGGTIFELKIK